MRLAALLLLAAAAAAQPNNQTTPGRFTVEHPTLRHLGFEWAISGDANRNATVQVQFRPTSQTTWRDALPLDRIGGERIFRQREGLDYTVPHAFAGSILNLAPDTEYECRFTLSDPDGASGQTTHTVKVRTRAEPQPSPRGRTLHVYSPEHEGPKLEPNFTSILQAYYGAGLGDWSVVWERRARPGDTILLHAGIYRPELLNYVDPMMTPFDGTNNLTLRATAAEPLTIKAAGDGEVILDGAGNHILFDLSASAHHIFDGLTIRNTDIAILAGKKEQQGATNLTVRNCRFENIGFGVWTESADSADFYIADNLFLGRDDRFRLIGWTGPLWSRVGPYGSHLLTSYYAIKIYGPGHVIARNAIAYFHDAIAISTYGTPPSDPNRQASSIDIESNDLHMFNDDFIETDGGVHNIRVFNNRGVNAAMGGYSAQPVFGGPAYFIGNVLYHVPTGVAFKFSAHPAGLHVYHNTIIGEQTARELCSNVHWANNLFMGRSTPARGVMSRGQADAAYSSDYNGFHPNPGVAAQYTLATPAGVKSYQSLKDLTTATGLEAHGRELDFTTFTSLAPPDPAKRHAVYHAADLDFSLRPNSPAIDAGKPIPTVNDSFQAKAPDLGALEQGAPPPRYGPRWLTWTPFYR